MTEEKKIVVGKTEHGSTYFEWSDVRAAAVAAGLINEDTAAQAKDDLEERVRADKRKDGWFNWSKT